MDFEQYVRFLIALAVVLALILVVMWGLRKLGAMGMIQTAGGSRRRRLSIVEVIGLDSRRRLVLVRRDDVEHLLVIGANGGDLVVESGIRSPLGEEGAATVGPGAA